IVARDVDEPLPALTVLLVQCSSPSDDAIAPDVVRSRRAMDMPATPHFPVSGPPARCRVGSRDHAAKAAIEQFNDDALAARLFRAVAGIVGPVDTGVKVRIIERHQSLAFCLMRASSAF